MVEEEDSFYMAVSEPKEFRRDLLSSSKLLIQLLQRNEHLKGLREKKLKLMHEFSDIFAEISMLTNKLKKCVPTTKLKTLNKAEHIGQQSHHKHPAHHTQHIAAGKVSSGELKALQEELAKIEDKLGKLS